MEKLALEGSESDFEKFDESQDSESEGSESDLEKYDESAEMSNVEKVVEVEKKELVVGIVVLK